jgi:predicted HicB family RNase H-like nuclease
VEFVVTQSAAETYEPPLEIDETSSSRTTLRLPDALKTRVDEAAAAEGLSVNTWLVRAVAAALQPKQRRAAQRAVKTGDNFAGWAR